MATFRAELLSVQTLAYVTLSAIILYLFYNLYIHPNYVSTIRNIPGPPTDSLLYGVLPAILKAGPGELHEKWIDQYGPTLQYRGFYGGNRLFLTDPKALNHILLSKSYEYPKPQQLRGQLARILGRGILFAEGEDHKRQRRIMNHPFTQVQVNSYLPIFQEQANKLCSKLEEVLDNPSKEEKDSREDWTVVDVTRWLSRVTLDIIGLAGFEYEFGALDQADNKLAATFNAMSKPRNITTSMIILGALAQYLPILTKIPNKTAKAVNDMMQTMESEGRKILQIRKEWAESGELDEHTDLMSLMVKSNINASNKKDEMREEELMGQITTFILAGHETSSTTLTWILMYMSTHLEIQKKLRNEVQQAKADALAAGRSELTHEQLSFMPFMDAIVRETLRCIPPVNMSTRDAAHDDVIPLSHPIAGRNGQSIDAIYVKKGQPIMIGIFAFNRSKEIFGEDADDYRPERWLEKRSDEKFQLAKGFTAWSSMLTFLGGPRGCIGYRFALLEIKAILAALIMNFEFRERDEGGTPLKKRSAIVTRPVVIGEEDLGSRLPLRMRKVTAV